MPGKKLKKHSNQLEIIIGAPDDLFLQEKMFRIFHQNYGDPVYEFFWTFPEINGIFYYDI